MNHIEEWEKQLQSLPFSQNNIICPSCRKNDFVCKLCIKDFIKSLLQKRDEEILAKVEGMKKEHEITCYFLEDGSYLKRHCNCGMFTYNQALEDLKQTLKSEGE